MERPFEVSVVHLHGLNPCVRFAADIDSIFCSREEIGMKVDGIQDEVWDLVGIGE